MNYISIFTTINTQKEEDEAMWEIVIRSFHRVAHPFNFSAQIISQEISPFVPQFKSHRSVITNNRLR